jgi:prophage regulatory protein
MKTGLSKSSIYNLISAKDFPQRVSLGSRSMGFLENEVNGWIASRAARRAI